MFRYTEVQSIYTLDEDAEIVLCGRYSNIKNKYATLEYKSGAWRLFLSKGYYWNGSDIVHDVDKCLAASAVHDFLCSQINDGHISQKYRIVADAEYVHLLKANGMGSVRAWFRGVGLAFARIIHD